MGCFLSTNATRGGRADAASHRVISETVAPPTTSADARPGMQGLEPRLQAAASSSRSRPRVALPSTSSQERGQAVHVGDKKFTSIHALEPAVRQALASTFNPIEALGLDDGSKFYRVTEQSRLQNGPSLEGHPQSMATVFHHEAMEPNPEYRSGVPTTKYHYDMEYEVQPYRPATVKSKDLEHPTLNVMFGSVAMQGAMRYAEKDSKEKFVLLEMTLGDLRAKGGGDVFFDAIRSDDERSIPLIVTLPKGKTVPVRVVHPHEVLQPDASDSD